MGGGLSTIRDFGRRGSKPNLLLSKLDTAEGEVEGAGVGALDGLSDSSAMFRGSVDSCIAELFGLLAVRDIVIGAGVKSYPPSSFTIVEPVDDGTTGLGAE